MQNLYFERENLEISLLYKNFVNLINEKLPIGTYNKPENKSLSYLYCEKYQKRHASFICPTINCPFQIFSPSLINEHKKCCKNTLEFINSEDIKLKGNIYNYFDANNFNFNNKKQRIRTIFDDLKNEIIKMIDSFQKIIMNKFVSQAKEFRMNDFIKIINEKFIDCKSKKFNYILINRF